MISITHRSLKAVDNEIGIIKRVFRSPNYNDEPNLKQYIAELCSTESFSEIKNEDRLANGISRSPEIALIKALGEAFERYSMSIYSKKDLIAGHHNELKNSVDPQSFQMFSKNQLSKPHMKVCLPNKFSYLWNTSTRLKNGNKYLIPSQLIYLPYYFGKEQLLRLPTSSGAAAGTTLESALNRSICELIERECFIIHWLNKITPPRVIIDGEKDYSWYINKFKKYHIDIHLFDISLDISIFTILCVLIDKSGNGPAITMGMKTSMDIKQAIIGSMEEAQQSRPWLRHLREKSRKKHSVLLKNQNKISTIEERALLWSDTIMIDKLEFLFQKKNTYYLSNYKKKMQNNLDSVASLINSHNIEIFWVDITPVDIKQIGFYVVKSVSPDLHPFYLSEPYRHMSGKRLYSLPVELELIARKKTEKELNCLAHPFL